MLWLLKMLQRIHRIQRRIFGPAIHHWARDGIALISYVNIIELLPTLFAITLAPRHFYTRLPQYIRSEPTWFKTPIKFFTTTTTLIAALLLFAASDAMTAAGIGDKTIVAEYTGLICLTAPLTIPIMCLAFRTMLAIFPATSSPSVRSNLLIPLSPPTYGRLEGAAFFWSIFYYGIYFFVALQILQWISLFLMGLMASLQAKYDECLSVSSGFRETLKSAALHECRARSGFLQSMVFDERFTLVILLSFLAVLGYWMLINPYLCLLRAAVKIPTKRMHRSDCYEVLHCIKQVVTAAKRRYWQGMFSRIDRLDSAVAALAGHAITQDRKAHRIGPKYFETLQRERAQVFGKAISLDEIKDLLKLPGLPPDGNARLVSLVDRMDRLSHTKKEGVSAVTI
jgi:hypothetical protein